MAKSNIILELTSGKCSLQIALKRLYVILSDLGNKELTEWVKKEMNGYSDEDELPEYRQVRCEVLGSYQLVGYGKIMTYNSRPLPMIEIPEDLKETMQKGKITMGISAINDALDTYKKGQFIGNPIPMEMWYLFEKGTNLTITNANRVISESEVLRVISNIESKIIDILLFLEKKFGNLDELDISAEKYVEKDLNNVAESCKQIIFSNCTFTNVDKLKIKSKNIATDDGNINNQKIKINKSNIGSGSNTATTETQINTEVAINKEEKKTCWLKKLFQKRSK